MYLQPFVNQVCASVAEERSLSGMVFSAQFDPGTQSDRRSSKRRALKIRVPADTSTRRGISVLIHDLSIVGMLIETHHADLTVGAILDVELPEVGCRSATVVWRRAGLVGCKFQQPLPDAGVSAALLRSHARLGAERSKASDLLLGGWEPNSVKLPRRIRVAIIVTSAILCWGVCFAAVAVIFA